MRIRPGVIAALVTAVAATAWLSQPASATAAGVADAGSATVVRGDHTIPVAPVAPCSLTGQQQGHSNGAARPGIVSYGPASSSCTTDAQAHTSTSTANGTNFALSVLQEYGGPLIRIAGYQVKCTANTTGTDAAWSFNGLSGVPVPAQVPQNYTIPVKAGNTLLANVILDEITLPNPNDGSITLSMMHIVLFPDGTPPNTEPVHGDVYVGSTACSPTV